jgi:methanogenic corrinoid protein MtbC1
MVVHGRSASLGVDALREHFLHAQLVGDRREAVRVVIDEGVAGGTSIFDLQTGVIQEAQVQVGNLWQQQRVSIAQEHMATAISHAALSALFERAIPKPRLGKKLLLACVEGEHHELPARLVADLLDLEGFDVRYLGANVPHGALASVVGQEKPDVVGLSVTMCFNINALRTAVERIRAVAVVPIMVGGLAVRTSPELAPSLGVVGDGVALAALIAATRQAVGLR